MTFAPSPKAYNYGVVDPTPRQLSYEFTFQNTTRFKMHILIGEKTIAIASVRRVTRQEDPRPRSAYALRMVDSNVATPEETIIYVRRLTGIINAWTHLGQLSLTPILPEFTTHGDDVVVDADIIKELEEEHEARNKEIPEG